MTEEILSTVLFYSAGRKWAKLGKSKKSLFLTQSAVMQRLGCMRQGESKSAKQPF
jgi:hypothetical protein